MPELNKSEQVVDPVVDPKNQPTNGKDIPNEPTDSDKKTVPLSELISERKRRQSMETELDKIKADQKTAADNELKRQGNLQKLLDDRDAEIKTLKPQVDEYNSYLSSKRDKIKADLGEKYKPYMDSMKLVDLEDLALTLNSKSPDPNLDKGAPPKKGDIVLSDQQKEEAKVMGLDEETYFNIQKNREKRKAAK